LERKGGQREGGGKLSPKVEERTEITEAHGYTAGAKKLHREGREETWAGKCEWDERVGGGSGGNPVKGRKGEA